MAKIKLKTNIETKQSMLETMQIFNEVCNGLSEFAFEFGIFRKYDLQEAMYYLIRDSFDLSAQMTLTAIHKVADSYKIPQNCCRKFRKDGAVVYDSRIITFYDNYVSIWTINGRIKVPFVCGEKQKALLNFQKGQTDLVYNDGNFYLHTCCEIAEEKQNKAKHFLGIDRGVNNIAADSLGNIYSGQKVISARKKYAKRRRTLQKVHSKSAKRRLGKIKRKESRFAKDVNHKISKKIVETAQRHGMGISLEDLTGIRKTTTVRKRNRYIRQSWSFYDLEQKILYKAKLKGIEVRKVNPRNTSRECFECGYTSKLNRKTQKIFLCQSCGHTDHADTNASRVISRRATVTWPIVGDAEVVNSCSSTSYKPLTSGRGC